MSDPRCSLTYMRHAEQEGWDPLSAVGFVVMTILDQTWGFGGADNGDTTDPSEAIIFSSLDLAGVWCQEADDVVCSITDLEAFRASEVTW